ncbi:MAG TPA: DUF559 domain-containing protein [Anaerolineae bacterium]|nr:DUF559 domain-containing protein [Anaerolineae bacterium]
MGYSDLEAAFLFWWRALTPGAPEPLREYRFAAEAVGGPGRGLRKRLADAGLRDWRFDFAWPEARVAVECEGGIYTRQAHGSVSGILRDVEKYNAATSLGWRVFRVTRKMLDEDPRRVVEMILEAIR